MIEVIGWLGTLLLITCALPQLSKVWITKKTEGLSMTMLYMWALGLLCMFIYELMTSAKAPLLANYSFSLVLDTILIASVHYFKRQNKH